MKESLDKKAVALVHQDIARFWYQAGLSFIAIRLPCFEVMVKSIGEFGKHLPVPSYHDTIVPLCTKRWNVLKHYWRKRRRYGRSLVAR